jgi:hypothetical protein
MQPFEALVVSYLIFLAAVSPFARVPARTRLATAIAAASMALAVLVVARTLPLEVRLCVPFLYVAFGYWLPVPLVPVDRGGSFEAWLRRTDLTVWRMVGPVPRWLASALEIGYLACFPLVPISFAAVWIAGSPADIARYWLGVLVSAYACYVTLPWLVSRPPRLIERSVAGDALSAISRLNQTVMGRVSHQLNTFPSGHVAVSVAAAIEVGKVWPGAGMVLGVVAGVVAIGAFVGRYHYFADVLAGAVVGAAASV